MSEPHPPSVCLICLTRRGALVNYQILLANGLNGQTQVHTVFSHSAPLEYLHPGIPHMQIEMGKPGAASTLLHLPGGMLQLWRALRSAPPADVYHVTSYQEWNLFTGLLLRALGKRLVYTVHDPRQHLGAAAYTGLLEKLFRPLAQFYIVLSHHSYLQMCEQTDAQRVLGAKLGDMFLEMPNPQAEPEQVILFQGRLEAYKGIPVLLAAARRVLPDFPGWKLVISGTGSLQLSEEQIAHPQIEFIHRFISEAEVARLYERAAIVTLPYLEATQSGVVSMAMVAGRAQVATRAGSLPEFVRDGVNGLLVEPGDVDGLAAALRRLMSDPVLRARLGAAGRRMYEEELNWEHLAGLHLDAYRRAVGQSM